MMTHSLAVGIDLGATKIAAVLIDRGGLVIDSRSVLTQAHEGVAAVLDRIAALIGSLIEVAPQAVDGIGLGSPGQVDPIEGVVRDAVNLGWGEVRVAAELRSRLVHDVPIWLEKDTNAGALGEYYFGAGQDCDDFVYLTIGSGLGGGVIANGRLINGATNVASELGHLSIDPIQGYACSCGRRGCAETIVSGRGLIAVTRDLLSSQKYRSSLKDRSALTTTDVLDAARSGDELACAAIEQVAVWLGLIMTACVSVLNPARFVIGGGLGLAAFDQLIPGATRELQRRVLAKSYEPLSIVRSQLTSSAIGAACMVWGKQALLEKDSRGG
jgi:glucokinase